MLTGLFGLAVFVWMPVIPAYFVAETKVQTKASRVVIKFLISLGLMLLNLPLLAVTSQEILVNAQRTVTVINESGEEVNSFILHKENTSIDFGAIPFGESKTQQINIKKARINYVARLKSKELKGVVPENLQEGDWLHFYTWITITEDKQVRITNRNLD